MSLAATMTEATTAVMAEVSQESTHHEPTIVDVTSTTQEEEVLQNLARSPRVVKRKELTPEEVALEAALQLRKDILPRLLYQLQSRLIPRNDDILGFDSKSYS